MKAETISYQIQLMINSVCKDDMVQILISVI